MYLGTAGQAVVAATYSRVSTNKQLDGISLADQEITILAYAERNEITVPEGYRFREAVSGLKDEREEYEKIRQLIRQRKINALLVYASDRHTRDPIHGKIFRAELRNSRCTLHIVSEGGEVDIYTAQGELMATIKDAFNRYWLDKILETTYHKKQAYLRQGVPFLQGVPRYGYVRQGKRGAAIAAIDEEVRPVIQRIYDLADAGFSGHAIARQLSDAPTPQQRRSKTSRKGKWGLTAVMSILRDEIYAGVFYGNRTSTVTVDGKRIRSWRPKEEWIRVEVPAIISREQWERVQQKLDAANSDKPKWHAKHEYLLGRRVRCGRCGRRMTSYPGRHDGKGRLYYRCVNAANPRVAVTACDLTTVFRADLVDAAVWERLCGFVRQPEAFLIRLEDAQEGRRESTERAQAQLDETAALLAENETQVATLVRELAKYAGRLPVVAAAIEQQLEQLGATEAALADRKRQLEARLKQKAAAEIELTSLADVAARIAPLLDRADFQTKRTAVELLQWQFELDVVEGRRSVAVLWFDVRSEFFVEHAKKPKQP
jgi:site-specific DNA recombinase